MYMMQKIEGQIRFYRRMTRALAWMAAVVVAVGFVALVFSPANTFAIGIVTISVSGFCVSCAVASDVDAFKLSVTLELEKREKL